MSDNVAESFKHNISIYIYTHTSSSSFLRTPIQRRLSVRRYSELQDDVLKGPERKSNLCLVHRTSSSSQSPSFFSSLLPHTRSLCPLHHSLIVRATVARAQNEGADDKGFHSSLILGGGEDGKVQLVCVLDHPASRWSMLTLQKHAW